MSSERLTNASRTLDQCRETIQRVAQRPDMRPDPQWFHMLAEQVQRAQKLIQLEIVSAETKQSA